MATNTDPPDFVDVVEPTYETFKHGNTEYTSRTFDDGTMQCPETFQKCTKMFDTLNNLKVHMAKRHECTANITETCARDGCENEFQRRVFEDTEFCSRECANLRHRPKNAEGNNTCNGCGDKFFAPPTANRTFCSRECYNDYRDGQKAREETDLVCNQCGETFSVLYRTDQKYCSRDCYIANTGSGRSDS